MANSNTVLSNADRKLDSFVLRKLESQYATQFTYDHTTRLTLVSDLSGKCQNVGCPDGVFFVKLAHMYNPNPTLLCYRCLSNGNGQNTTNHTQRTNK